MTGFNGNGRWASLSEDSLPHHLAIIMDGSGRWAKKKLLGRDRGHSQGARAVRRVVTCCRRLGIPILTLYAFSLENWSRPPKEVAGLMRLLHAFLGKELETLMENDIRLMAMGRLEMLPARVREKLLETCRLTDSNKGMILNLALSYGGRAEIIDAVKGLLEEVRAGRLTPEDVDERVFSRYLYTAGLPDPDFLIRTSGEFRISNFLLWQTAYTEIYVTKKLWPEFTEEDLLEALLDFQSRERRFGLTSEQLCQGRRGALQAGAQWV